MKKPPFPTKEDLVRGYIDLQQFSEGSEGYEESFWSCMVFDDLVDDYPQEALDVVISILEIDSSMKIVGPLAAGPLEDIIIRHGPTIIDRIEREAKICPKLNNALGGVWKSNCDDEVWGRIEDVRNMTW